MDFIQYYDIKIRVDNLEGRATKGSINVTEGSTTTTLQRVGVIHGLQIKRELWRLVIA